MANLWTGKINTENQYQDLATLTELTFDSGSAYIIQGLDGGAYFLREGEVGQGFYVEEKEKVQYIAGADDLYIKTFADGDRTINIAG